MCYLPIKWLHILAFSLSHEFLPLEKIYIVVLINVGFIRKRSILVALIGDRSQLDILSPIQLGPYAVHLSFPSTTFKHATFIYPG